MTVRGIHSTAYRRQQSERDQLLRKRLGHLSFLRDDGFLAASLARIAMGLDGSAVALNHSNILVPPSLP